MEQLVLRVRNCSCLVSEQSFAVAVSETAKLFKIVAYKDYKFLAINKEAELFFVWSRT